MASMRESDTGLWLHNKLGATDELWAPPSIASLLTAAVIDNIRLCFHGLSSAVKLKLLLGTLHLPRRTVDEVRRARRPPGAEARTSKAPALPSQLPCPPPFSAGKAEPGGPGRRVDAGTCSRRGRGGRRRPAPGPGVGGWGGPRAPQALGNLPAAAPHETAARTGLHSPCVLSARSGFCVTLGGGV